VASAASASDAVNARMSARMSAVARRLHLVMAGAPIGGGAESKSSSRRARWVRRVPAGRRGMDVPTRLATLSAALDEAATSVEGERARRCERRRARSGPSGRRGFGRTLVGRLQFFFSAKVMFWISRARVTVARGASTLRSRWTVRERRRVHHGDPSQVSALATPSSPRTPPSPPASPPHSSAR
jgi:hypothetical protein